MFFLFRSFSISSLLVTFCLVVSGCQIKQNASETQSISDKETMPAVQTQVTPNSDSFTDPRDGETYTTVRIGNQYWLAENLRFDAPGSWQNPDNPSTIYGRLYNAVLAQTVCPPGWHLPSDAEWNELELFLGMDPADTVTSTWRGAHAPQLKSATGWGTQWAGVANGTNSSGFNAYPAGYCAPENGQPVFEGLGHSVGFWAAIEDGVSWQRWLGAPLKGVNRQPDDLSSDFASACRCIRD